MRKPTVASGLPWQRWRVPASCCWQSSLAVLGVAALMGSAVVAMLKGAIVLLALSFAGLGVAALLGSTVLVMLKGAVVLASFVWVAAVASRRYGHGSWLRSDGRSIGYTVAVEVMRKPLLTLLVMLGLGFGVAGTGLVDLPHPPHPGLHWRLPRAAKARGRRARHGSPMAARAT